VSPAKTVEPIEMPFGLWARMGPKNHVLDEGPQVLRDVAMATVFVFLYMECTLAPPGEYDWTVRVRRRCGLMSNYFDHLLLHFAWGVYLSRPSVNELDQSAVDAPSIDPLHSDPAHSIY